MKKIIAKSIAYIFFYVMVVLTIFYFFALIDFLINLKNLFQNYALFAGYLSGIVLFGLLIFYGVKFSWKNLSKYNKKKEEPKGIAGWLSAYIVLVVISIFVLVFYFGYETLSTLADDTLLPTEKYIILVWIMFYYFIVIFSSCYIVHGLEKKKPRIITFIKVFYIFYILMTLITLNIPEDQLEDVYSLYGEADSSFFLVFPLAWLAYFTFSRRVNNTYPKKNRKLKLLDYILFSFMVVALIFASYGVFSSGSGDPLKNQTDEYCKNHCDEVPNAVSHITQLVRRDKYFVCLCYNKQHVPIDRTEWDLR